MEKMHIQFTLFSAFYSPLISTMSGGFLKAEGIDASYSVAPPGVSAIKALEEGTAQVIQSAPSQGFTSLDKGETPTAIHFAQINEMDGFFITAREADAAFNWKKLEGADVVMFGGGQPLAMFKYACHKAGIDFDKINAITPGGAADIDKAFRDGQGAYVQQQGPFPQQLEADSVGHIVAQVGPKIGPNAFSSLASTREWLATDQAKAFMRAYTKTRQYMIDTPADEIAKAEKSYFPNIDEAVLAKCIASYQKLGCWTPHVEITKPAFEVALDVFEHFGTLKKRYAYEQVCALPPAG
jgi:NitT/TauT family transport system substrate-binding protein